MKLAAAACVLALALPSLAQTPGTVIEYPIHYPNQTSSEHGSTHEIEKDADSIWITGQNDDQIVHVALDGSMTFYPTPKDSGPHGIEFDSEKQLWIALEFAGKVVRVSTSGKVTAVYDVTLDCSSCPKRINTNPHGLGIGADGKTVWYTGKSTGTIGRITPDGKVATFALKTAGSVPIYIKAGPDGNMWATELCGNAIARVKPDGDITEFSIPTKKSRPIAIVPEPGGQAMWFSEESSNQIARIDMNGNITEFPIPKPQPNVILAGLAFDSEKNLWTQQYVDQANPAPAGADRIIKIDKSILTASDISNVPITYYAVPSRNTVFHRIIEGPDGNMWFTEMHADTVGKVVVRGK